MLLYIIIIISLVKLLDVKFLGKNEFYINGEAARSTSHERKGNIINRPSTGFLYRFKREPVTAFVSTLQLIFNFNYCTIIMKCFRFRQMAKLNSLLMSYWILQLSIINRIPNLINIYIFEKIIKDHTNEDFWIFMTDLIFFLKRKFETRDL